MITAKSLIDAILYLNEKGYSSEFFLNKGGVLDSSTGKQYLFNEIAIKETIKVEVKTHDTNQISIHAIELTDGKKGAFIEASEY